MRREPYFVPTLKLVLAKDISFKIFFTELRYWYVKRHMRKFIPWVARKLPTKLKYFVVIDGMVQVNPNDNPTNVKGIELLELWKAGVE